MFIFVLILFCFSSFSENLGSATLDPNYENYLYRVYKDYHSQSISSSKWRNLINQKNVNVYPVQKGDNLWDVSRVLFGDPNYWPKLWSVNSKLANPHRISAGHQLQIIMGTEGEAPRTVISRSEINPKQNVVNASLEREEVATNVYTDIDTVTDVSCVEDLSSILHLKGTTKAFDQKYKCPSMRRKIVSRRKEDKEELYKYLNSLEEPVEAPSIPERKKAPVPNSFPHISLVNSDGDLIFTDNNPFATTNKSVVTSYQVDSDDIDVVGEVNEILGGVAVPSSGIILDLDVPAQSGDTFSLIQPLHSVRSQVRNPFILEGGMGDEVVMQARVTITGNVAGQNGLYFAEINSMYNPIGIKSKVIREDVVTFDLSGASRKGNAKSQIIASAHNQSGSMMMVHSFVYLNKGSSDGVSLGDSFDIRSNPRLHGRNVKTSLGEILVVHVTPSYSTAFVRHLNDLAYVGDYALSFDNLNEYILDEEENDIIEEEDEEDGYYSDEEMDVINGEEDLEEDSDEALDENIEEDNFSSDDDFDVEESASDESQEIFESSILEEENDASDESQGVFESSIPAEDGFVDEYEDEEDEWFNE